MKPTVIANPGNSENPQSHQSRGNNVSSGPNTESGNNTTNAHHSNVRQFPPFQTGFDFDPDMDDIFSDAGLRSRLNRFREPFGFARKRCGNNDSKADSYNKYFEDDTDFFPHFGSLPGRRRGTSHSGSSPFFDHIPSEFRHYIPDSFGFPQSRSSAQQSHPQQQQHQQYPQPQEPQYPQHPQQYYEAFVQPSSPTYSQPPQQKPKLCDAAIQTDDLGEQSTPKETKNLKQYGMRNTVDLGQKSPQEENREPRSQSAPPTDGPEQSYSNQSTTSSSNPQGAYATANSYAYASSVPTEGTQKYNPQRTPDAQQTTPPHPPPRQHGPNPNQSYQPWHPQQQQQPQQPQQPQPSQQQYQQPSPQQNTQTGNGFVRTVPIFVEGRSNAPLNKTRLPQEQQQQPQQQPQQQHQQPKQKPGHPTPLNTQQTPPPSNQMPPQTPHTTECISKIQAIQHDVLDLMSKVENFQGMRNDKEYMYLDEMLTRNLLKLDTIDTNGKDSIRLARREAIKCIQASINVLEAKAEENAKAAQQTVMNTEEQTAEGMANNENKENIENESSKQTLGNVVIPLHPPQEKQSEKVAIPLPPPPEKNQDQNEDQSIPKSNETKNVEQISKNDREPEALNSELTEKIPSEKEVTADKSISGPNLPDSVEKSVESTNKEGEGKFENPEKSESVNPKEGTECDGVKSTGAVKKKIIKKKKAVKDKTGKAESCTPEEKLPETTEKPQTELELDDKFEKNEEKSEKDINAAL